MNNKSGNIAIILLIVVVLLGGGYYAWKQSAGYNFKNAQIPAQESADVVTTIEKKTYEGSSDTGSGVKVSGRLTGDVMTTVDCGDKNCFSQKFAVCEPATMQSDLGTISASYKIVKPTTTGCSVTMKYTKAPTPVLLNKEMTCDVDNKLGFEKSFQDTFSGAANSGTGKCQGPLLDAMLGR